ncbi:hypothetical protein B0H19DRAFT_1077597 [Mycena capillaripes]|nr:hypothetical protein B0H19DRAFT_1077597 [Mycena capillaripes]
MPLSAREIQSTALATVSALKAANLSCCLAGSSACYEWGNSRIPNDVDILVLSSTKTAEEIKDLLVSSDPNFSLALPEKNPLATYRVLWYTLAPTTTTTTTNDTDSGSPKQCPVDIFLPGVISLPFVPTEFIVQSPNGLPVMPLLSALMHKILAWIAHGQAHRTDKQENDLTDISGLLNIVDTRLDLIVVEDKNWYPDWFVNASFNGVARYVEEFPESAGLWKTLEGSFEKTGTGA